MAGPIEHYNFPPGESIKIQHPGMALAAINSIDSVIQIASDVNVVLDQVMDTVREIFNSSRAWLFHPCNPKLPSFTVTFESTTSEYPGANALKQQVPMTDDMADYCRRALSADGPEIDPPEGQPITNDIAIRFNVKSMLFMALRPKSGEPWMFGLHQCDLERIWTNDEKQLFHMIGQRITGCIDSLLYVRQLEESEQRFRSYVENANDIVYAVSPEGLFTYVSPNWLEFMGEPADDAIGNSFKPYVHPEDVHFCQEFLEKVLTSGQKQSSVEYRVRHKDGSWRWHVSNGSPMKDPGGNVTGYLGIARDVTDKKQTENALRESEEKFSKAFQSAPLLMTITSVDDGRFLDVNDAFVSLTGYSRDIAIGSRSTEIGFIELEERNRMLDVLKTEGRVKNFELKVKRADGSQMVCLYSAEIFNLKGQKRLLSTAIDISDMKKAELELRESEEIYRKLVRTAPYGIQLTDRRGKIIFSNPAHHKIQGYDDGELIGKFIWDLMVNETHRQQAKTYYQKLIQDHPSPNVYFNRDKTRDGREIEVQINWDYIYDSDGEIEGIISIISDITNQNQLERQLQQAQKMEAIGTLAGGIAHDFNNILYPLMGFTEMLKEDVPSDSPLHNHIDEILQASFRAKDLVKQILAFSRQGEQELRPIKLQPIIKEALKLLRSSIPTTIDIEQEIDPACGVVVADPTQVHQIIMNLVTNAYHAMEETGGQLTVRLEQVRLEPEETLLSGLTPGDYAMLRVTDTGPGIEKDVLDKIFDPYFTTKGTGKGTGLGLSVVQGIVKRCHGDIQVLSEPGQGTEVQVYLPVKEQVSAEKQIDHDKPVSGGTEKILLVDDEASIVKMEQQMLERLGYTVTFRTGSLDALEAFKADPQAFDLVVTDMTMPNMTGVQLAAELKRVRPDIPVVLCTGFSYQVNEKKSKALGIDAFVMKPVIKEEIAATIRNVLDN